MTCATVAGLTSWCGRRVRFRRNMFALMGLRQLYFLLGDLLKRLVYPSQGVAFIRGEAGAACVTRERRAIHRRCEHVNVPEILTLLSLAVIVVTLLVTTVASLYKTRFVDKE